MKYSGRLSLLLLAASPLVWGQAPQSEQLKQMQFMVGQWSCTGENLSTPPTKAQSTFECAWDKSGLILICQQQNTPPTPAANLWAYAYDPQGKVHTVSTLTSAGFSSILSGSVQDGKQDLARDGVWNGKPARYEFHAAPGSSAGTMDGVWRRSVGGGPWVVFSEYKCTKR